MFPLISKFTAMQSIFLPFSGLKICIREPKRETTAEDHFQHILNRKCAKLVWSEVAGTRNNSSGARDKLIRLGLTESTDKKPTTRQHHWRTWASFTSRLTSTHSSSFVRSIRVQPLNPYRITRHRPKGLCALRAHKKAQKQNTTSLSLFLFVYWAHKEWVRTQRRLFIRARRISFPGSRFAYVKKCCDFLHALCADYVLLYLNLRRATFAYWCSGVASCFSTDARRMQIDVNWVNILWTRNEKQ